MEARRLLTGDSLGGEDGVRIGTWNLAGRWQPQHEEFVAAANCDVWLLTEVNERVDLDGYERHLTAGLMAPKRRWAGVFSRAPLQVQSDPHWATAAVVIDGTTYWSSILPWRSCGPWWPGTRHAEKTALALAELLGESLPQDLVWGGDWNHALDGVEWAGSKGGRAHVLAAVEQLDLTVPTADQPHQLDGHRSIDHIAVAAARDVARVEHLRAVGLSDHDCYVVELRSH